MKQPQPPEEVLTFQRLDKWLWYARFAKSRSIAAKVIEGGYIRVNRLKVTRPSVCVKRGDVLTATLYGKVRLIEISDIASRRGSPSEAIKLYNERAIDKTDYEDAQQPE